MRAVVHKKSNSEDSIGEVLTAVYYKSPAMPLDVPNLWNTLDSSSQALLRTSGKAQEIRYNAGELGVDYRFFEYGLQYFPNPEGILPAVSEGMANTLFRDSSGTWIGTGDFKDIGKYLIPTHTSASGGRSGIKFFGSFRTATQEIYVFPAGPGISKIELYDINIDPSDISKIYDSDLGYGEYSDIKPIISFYLGCSGELSGTPRWSNNIDQKYFIGDVQKDIDLDWKLYSERFDSKVVFLSISQRKEKNLQVSYESWLKLYEPLRNKPSYDVLIPERTEDPSQIGETIEGHKFDLASGSYLGSPDSRPKPILEEKLRKQRELDKMCMYNAWRRYGPGDVARYGGNLWVSLCQDNCGNVPGYSEKWVLQDRMTDFYTSWFVIKCQDAKEIVPGFKINVPDYQKESAFELYPKPGYIPTEASVNNLGKDKTISRVVMTENIDLDEKRYYIFYIKWNPAEKSKGNIRGRVLELRLEKKPLHPVIRIPDFIIQRSQGKYELTWNNNIDIFDLKVPGKNIVIDDSLDCSIIENIRKKVAPGTGLSKKQADDAFESFIEKLEFTLEYEKSVPGKTWETGGSEVEPKVNIFSSSNTVADVILHEDKIDYENCKYTLIPGWNYKKVTISNSGDFDIEYPVLDVVRTENYKSGAFSRTGVTPSELMIKYRKDSGEWSEWQHTAYNGSSASWYHPGGGSRNEVHLDRTGTDLYEIQVNSVTVDLIIDIKV